MPPTRQTIMPWPVNRTRLGPACTTVLTQQPVWPFHNRMPVRSAVNPCPHCKRECTSSSIPVKSMAARSSRSTHSTADACFSESIGAQEASTLLFKAHSKASPSAAPANGPDNRGVCSQGILHFLPENTTGSFGERIKHLHTHNPPSTKSKGTKHVFPQQGHTRPPGANRRLLPTPCK